MNFKELRQKAKMSMKEMSDYFGIPYRTIQNWESGVSACPGYLQELMLFKLSKEGKLNNSSGMYIDYETRIASRIKVRLDGTMRDYFSSFVAIYNNVKSDNDLWKMYNDYGNGVYIVCNPSVEEGCIKFLQQFGTVSDVQQVRAIAPWCENIDIDDDLDIEFLEVTE